MEAMGLLSGLMHMRLDIKWQGQIEWHMDSKSVIDTYKKCHRLTNAEWTKQRDKDVWETLIIEKQKWWDRLTILHVKAHTDTKKNKTGEKRTVTQLEKMNQHADTLADTPYNIELEKLETQNLPKQKNSCQINAHNRIINGNWRKQILEEIRIETKN